MSELSRAVERKIAEYQSAGIDRAAARVRAITEAHMEELKKNGASKKTLAEWAAILDETKEAEQKEKAHLMRVLDGPALTTAGRILEAGGKPKERRDDKEKQEDIFSLKREGFSITVGEGEEIIFKKTHSDKKGFSQVIASSSKSLTKVSPTAVKLFRFILSEVNTCIANGSVLPGKDSIILSFKDLSEGEGAIYRDRSDARRTIRQDLDIITPLMYKLQFLQWDEETKRQKTIKTERFQLFSKTSDDIKGKIEIKLNVDAPWMFLAPAIVLMPTFFLELSKIGSELLWYLYRLAQNIIENGGNITEKDQRGRKVIAYTVKLETIRKHLMLPAPSETKHARQDILGKINNAANEINTRAEGLITVTVEEGPGRRIEEVIAGGKVKIEIKGEYAEAILAIMQRKLIKKAEADEAEEKKAASKDSQRFAKIAHNGDKKIEARLDEMEKRNAQRDAAIEKMGKGVHVLSAKLKQLDAMETESQRKEEN